VRSMSVLRMCLELNMSSSWEVLGIPSGSSEAEIRHAFRQKAFKVHPDHGGSAEEFKKLYAAYEDCLHQVAPGVEVNLDELFKDAPGIVSILKAMQFEVYAPGLFESIMGEKVHFTYGRKRGQPEQRRVE